MDYIQVLQDLGIFVGIPIIRSVGGWLQHAFEDKKVDSFEWKLLVSTVVRVGTMGLAMYLGLNGMGFDVNALAAAASAFVADHLFRALKK